MKSGGRYHFPGQAAFHGSGHGQSGIERDDPGVKHALLFN